MIKLIIIIFFTIFIFSNSNSGIKVNTIYEGNIDAKVHYPIPMHLQPAAEKFNYKKGDFPKAEFAASSSISLPVHEFISEETIFKGKIGRIRDIKIDKETGELYMLSDRGELWRMYKWKKYLF